MAIKTLENGFVSDEFSFETQYGIFKDAIVLSAEEYSLLTSEDIESFKQQSLTNWLSIVEAPQE
jgi:hypothetical protein